MNKYTIPKLLTEYIGDFQLNIGGGNGLDKYFEVFTNKDVKKAYSDGHGHYVATVDGPAWINIETGDFETHGCVWFIENDGKFNAELFQYYPLIKDMAKAMFGEVSEDAMYAIAYRIFGLCFVEVDMPRNCRLWIANSTLAEMIGLTDDKTEIPISELPEFRAADITFDYESIIQAVKE